MSISNFQNFKNELKEHLNTLKEEIKVLIYKEFKNYIFTNKISNHHQIYKSFLTKAFCELTTYCYIKNFHEKLFNSKSYEIIKDYIKNSERQFLEKDFKNVVLVSASKLSKSDEKLNYFISQLMNNFKANVWVKNLDWYNNEHFLKEVKLDKRIDIYQEELLKIIKHYDKDLFDYISEYRFKSTKLNFKEDWKVFLEKNVIYSLEKFIFTPLNYDEENYEIKMQKLFDLVIPNTIFIFINNIEVKDKYKTTLLNDLSFFSKIIKYDVPIFTMDNNYFFSLLNALSIKNFKNYNDILEFLHDKPIERVNNDLTMYDVEDDDPLNWNWEKILKSENNWDKHLDKQKPDLQKTIDFNENTNLDEILKEHESMKVNEDFTELLTVLTQENNLLLQGFPKKVTKDFKRFIKTFDKEINNVRLLTDSYDKNKFLDFRNYINQKNIEEVIEFLSKKIDSLIEVLENKEMTKQDAMNYYALYIKIKSCLNEIEFLKLK